MLAYQVKSLYSDPSAEIPVDEVFELDPLENSGDPVTFAEPVSVHGLLRPAGGKVIEFQGTVDTKASMACSRCTKPTYFDMHSDVLQRYVTEDQAALTDDEDAEIFDGEMIDLTDLVAGEISLAVPMKILCREDCKGLCPRCGKDLNEGPCDCDTEDTDPRWDALKSLL